MKEYIKSKIVEFWRKHPDFDDRNPEHLGEVRETLNELSRFPLPVIYSAIEDLRREAEIEVEEARKRFYASLKEVRSGVHSMIEKMEEEQELVPGYVECLRGSSENEDKEANCDDE